MVRKLLLNRTKIKIELRRGSIFILILKYRGGGPRGPLAEGE